MLLFELEYKGKTYYAHFSHYAISRTETELGQPLIETLKTVSGQEELMYHAVVAGCEQKSLKPCHRKDIPFMIDANMAKIEWMTLKSLQAIDDEKKRLGMSLLNQKDQKQKN